MKTELTRLEHSIMCTGQKRGRRGRKNMILIFQHGELRLMVMACIEIENNKRVSLERKVHKIRQNKKPWGPAMKKARFLLICSFLLRKKS